jgi:hypothetical protein
MKPYSILLFKYCGKLKDLHPKIVDRLWKINARGGI